MQSERVRGESTGVPGPVRVTGDGSRTLWSERYGQTYHSHHGAWTEARHVFLAASGVQERLARGDATRVLEVGFGTGLNVLATADAALVQGARVELVSLEHALVSAATLRALEYGRHLAWAGLFEALVGVVERVERGESEERRALRAELAPGVVLELRLGDACTAEVPSASFDAVYLDAFSPEANPELWDEPFLARLFAALAPGGRLATYSAKGRVRRGLAAVGFAVERRPGPPGKREMLVARRE